MFKMARDILSLEASTHREKLLEYMANSDHSPFYTEGEMKEHLGLKQDDLGETRYFHQFLGILANQHELTNGGAAAPDKYVLPYRLREFSRQHEGQVL